MKSSRETLLVIVRTKAVAYDLSLVGADLQGIDLAHLRVDGGDFEAADLSRASLVETRWTHCKLHDVRLEASDLTGAVFRSCDLDHARANKAILTRAHLENSTAQGARLDEADLSRAILDDTDFARASLRGANLEGVAATGAGFRGADLRRARLREASLVDADLSGADLTDADLTGADLRGAILDGVLWAGAAVAGVRFDDGAARPAHAPPDELPPPLPETTAFAAVDALGGLLRAAVSDPRLQQLAELLTAEPERAPLPGDARRIVDALRHELAARGVDISRTLLPLERALTSLENAPEDAPPEDWKPVLERLMSRPPASVPELIAAFSSCFEGPQTQGRGD